MAEKPYQDEELLRELYWEDGKSIKETAEACDCAINTIQRYMDKFDIPTRDVAGYAPGEKPKYRDEDWLREKYNDEGMSLKEMSDEAGASTSAIIDHMERHGIDRREAGGVKLKRARFYTNNHGHELWESWTESHGSKYLPVHRLIAVAEHGFEAVADNHVHHKNHIPWDNRPENLEVLSVSEHRSYHAKEMGLSEMGAEATRGTTRD